MNLVQRYIQAVKIELPPAQREDIGRKLHMIALGLRGANGARVLFFNLRRSCRCVRTSAGP